MNLSRYVLFAAMTLMAMTMAGCADNVDAVISDQDILMQDYLAVLKTVKDDASAKEASQKIEGLVDRKFALAKRLQSMEFPLSEAEMKKVLEGKGKNAEKGAATAASIAEEMARIREAGFSPIINKAVTKFNRTGL